MQAARPLCFRKHFPTALLLITLTVFFCNFRSCFVFASVPVVNQLPAAERAAPDERADSGEPAESAPPDTSPLSKTEQEQLKRTLTERLQSLPEPTGSDRSAFSAWSQRGDLLFFLGRFKEAADAYSAMLKIDPSAEASHWRRGIALFFTGEAEQAARQFDLYDSYDDVDRENGIWRYLCHYKAHGPEKAESELLRYEKDDREPFPTVYRIFSGDISHDDAIAAVPTDLPESERDKRFFYTELYVGLHLLVQQRESEAADYLSRAVRRNWPRTAGYGPNFMWHVARVQCREIEISRRKAREQLPEQ